MEFLSDNFLLHTKTAKTLYHEFAATQPIIDYHNHLSPIEIANNVNYKSITEIWLHGDHYKWRAMRANGIDEKYITGDVSDFEKFLKWAETVPYAMRNPLYHWTHMELKKPFGVNKLLSSQTARGIYDQCNEMLQSSEFTAQALLNKFNVEIVCTTDSPLDDLAYHKKLAESNSEIRMFPTFRPDGAVAIEDGSFVDFVYKLGKLVNVNIQSYNELIDALKTRAAYFAQNGCAVSDMGMDTFYAEDYTEQEIDAIFKKALEKQTLTIDEIKKYKSSILVSLGSLYNDLGWVQQFHFGVIRNLNTKLSTLVGVDAGVDSMNSENHAVALAKFLDRLNRNNALTKTILYNLNPNDNDMLATMVASFSGGVAGKIQFGAAWWFNDQKQGMIDQLNSLSNHGLLSRFVGMLTDSRSMLSFSRHEYFRRILCQLLGNDIENGELPNDIDWIGNLVNMICYKNTKEYFQFSNKPRVVETEV